MTSDPERWKTLRFQHADVLGDYLLNADDIYRSSNPSAKNAIDWEVVEYQRAKGQLVGVCLGYFSSSGIGWIDDLIIDMKPSNLSLLAGRKLSAPERDCCRADYASRRIKEKILD